MIRRVALVALVALAGACRPRLPLPLESGARFTDLGDATVRDNRFSIVWTRSAGLPGVMRGAFDGLTWPEALDFVAAMNAGTRPNFGYTDWRLPHVEDLLALTGAFWVQGSWIACLNDGANEGCDYHVPFAPFTDVADTCYWSGTTATTLAWRDGRGPYVASAVVAVGAGEVTDVWAVDTRASPFPVTKTVRCGVWPLRGNARVVQQGGHDLTGGATAGEATAAPTIPIIAVPGALPH